MLAKIWNFSRWVGECGESVLSEYLDAAVEGAGFNVLGVLEYKFQPQGYTKIYLLAESHLAVHTFPEHDVSYIELSSCNEEKYNSFVEMFVARFPEAW